MNNLFESVFNNIYYSLTGMTNSVIESLTIGMTPVAKYKFILENQIRKTDMTPIDEAIKNGFKSCVIYYDTYECSPMGIGHKVNQHLKKYNDPNYEIIGSVTPNLKVWCNGSNTYEAQVILEVKRKDL